MESKLASCTRVMESKQVTYTPEKGSKQVTCTREMPSKWVTCIAVMDSKLATCTPGMGSKQVTCTPVMESKLEMVSKSVICSTGCGLVSCMNVMECKLASHAPQRAHQDQASCMTGMGRTLGLCKLECKMGMGYMRGSCGRETEYRRGSCMVVMECNHSNHWLKKPLRWTIERWRNEGKPLFGKFYTQMMTRGELMGEDLAFWPSYRGSPRC